MLTLPHGTLWNSWLSVGIVIKYSRCVLFADIGADFFYRSTACNATHGIAMSQMSVRPSVKRVNYDKTTETWANILIPHERPFILEWLVGRLVLPEIFDRTARLLQKRRFSIDIRS